MGYAAMPVSNGWIRNSKQTVSSNRLSRIARCTAFSNVIGAMRFARAYGDVDRFAKFPLEIDGTFALALMH
jgi:hypothetical protein